MGFITDNILARAGIFIILLGISISLPNFNTILIDFTSMSQEAINIAQIGVATLGFAIFIGGDI